MLPRLTKQNAHLFVKKNKEKTGKEITALDSVIYTDCSELLNQCRDAYDKLREVRDKTRRSINYTFGRQWEDYIVDPESDFVGQKIKEEDYIKRQGFVPLKYNIINKSFTTVTGLYARQSSKPVAVSRDRDKQKLGEMMTIAVHYAYDQNKIKAINTNMLRTAFCSSFFCRSVYYRINDERQVPDVWVQVEDLFKMFYNPDVQDPLFRDVTMIGAIRDMSKDELIGKFAHNDKEAKMLDCEYPTVPKEASTSTYLYAHDKDRDGMEDDFYSPKDPYKCRVYEVWRKETRRAYFCHDRAAGEWYYIHTPEQIAEVKAENERRKAEMVALGFTSDDANLIECDFGKWELQYYWYVRYLTPQGKCIMQGESPYEHGSHPFTIGAYPMINGEIQSLAERAIDPQRAFNRMFSQFDFIRQTSAKGLKMCPITAIPDDMTPEQFARQSTRVGDWIFYKPDPTGGNNIPKVVHDSSVAVGDIEILKMFKQLNDEISGISSALHGDRPASGTPATRYAQEAQNSAINLVDFMDWFNGCVLDADTKMMQVMEQFYDDERYIPIVGRNYHEESKYYDPAKIRNTKFDLVVQEMEIATPAYRQLMQDTLLELLKEQAIDIKSYLEASDTPFADQLLEIVKRNEKEQAQLQRQMGEQPLQQQTV